MVTARLGAAVIRGRGLLVKGGTARSFLSGSGLALLAKLVNGVAIMAINAVLARQLAAAEFALYLLAYSAVVIGGLVLTLGLHIGGPRFIGEARGTGEPGRVHGAYRALLWILSASSLVLGLIVALLGDRLLGRPAEIGVLGPWLALWIAATSWRAVSANTLRVLDRHAVGSLFDGPVATLAMLLTLLALVPLHAVTIERVLMIGALTSVASALPCQLALSRALGPAPKPAGIPPKLMSVLVISLPMLVGSLVGQLSFQLPLWLLSRIGAPEEVALYGAGAQFFNALNLAFGVVAIGAMPVIIRLHAAGERVRLARFARAAALVSTLPMAAAVLLLLVWAPDLAALAFGEPYRASGFVALSLCTGLLLQTLFGLNFTLLTLTGAQLVASALLVCCTLLLLLLAWLGYAAAGVAGTAVATAAVMVLQNSTLSLLVWRRLGFLPFAWPR